MADKPKRHTTVGPIGPAGPMQSGLAVGDVVEVEIGSVAHGGHCVARHDGRVIFVRHALPGERAVVRITEVKRDSFCRGDAIDLLRANQQRHPAPCSHFVPGGCGGCDFQHADPQLQLQLKADVVAEQLRRLAGITMPVTVEPLPGSGFGWRTRVRWAVDRAGQVGPRAVRSHEVVPVSPAEPCLIAGSGLTEFATSPPVLALVSTEEPKSSHRGGHRGRHHGSADLPELALSVSSDGVLAAANPAAPTRYLTSNDGDFLTETVHGRKFRVAIDGFWQVHPAAAAVLVDTVLAYLPNLVGAVVWDLYAGAGLFSAFLAERVGPSGRVVSVELDGPAVAFARQNLAEFAQVQILAGRVDTVIADSDLAGTPVSAIVLDPPRSGAGRSVCEAMVAGAPTAIVYVACDPAALARDAATLADLGYQLADLRAFDAFPQTHHVECVAKFVRAQN